MPIGKGDSRAPSDSHSLYFSTALFHSAKLASNRRVCWATEFDAHVAWDPTQPLFFTLEELQQGYIVIDVLISLYLFGALAIVCSNYFVPSVETFTHGTFCYTIYALLTSVGQHLWTIQHVNKC